MITIMICDKYLLHSTLFHSIPFTSHHNSNSSSSSSSSYASR